MEFVDSQNNDVVILGNIVVRRPRHAEAIAGIYREVATLSRFRQRLSLPTPQVQVLEIEDEVIALHKRLPGEPLWSVQNLSEQSKERLAFQLGVFLKSLHEIETNLVDDLQLPRIDQNWWLNFLDKAERLVFFKLASTTAEALRYQIHSHIEQLPSLPYTLLHGDFGSSNILSDGRDITGIIDFGSLGWGDPGWDISGLFVSYGSRFVERIIPVYPAVEHLLQRSPFYQLMFALMEAVFGAEQSDDKAFNLGLDALKVVA